MRKTIFRTAVFAFVLTYSANAQNTKEHGTYPNDEIDYYVVDGVKMSQKTKTPLLFAGIHDAVEGATPVEMAKNWIEFRKNDIKVEEVNNLVSYSERTGRAGSTIRLRQYHQGIPVFQSEIVVHISPRNEVTYVYNTFDPTVQIIDANPSISAEKALNLAKKAINTKGGINFESNELNIYNRGGSTRLIHKIILEPQDPLGSWEVLVDAHNGEIIRAADKACNHKDHNHEVSAYPPPVSGTGTVFLPDPLSQALVTYGGSYSDGSDATNGSLDAAMSTVTLLDINFTGSNYELIGPYAEIQDFENPWKGLFTQTSSVFNYNRNDDAFEAVNTYYHIDNSMRYINDSLLISLMPFQYTTGVRFDPSGLNGQDNSHYLGGSGKLAFGEGGVDDAEDADVILHELGHGLHDWLTNGNLSQVDGLSEGSGDYWCVSYSKSLNQWSPADPQFNWVFSWDGHNPFWGGRITNYTATYPGGLTGAIHTDGQIWASALHRIYDIIGRTKVDMAFLEGLAMTGSNTSQQDAAIAVRQAAIDMNYSCADVDVFTVEFTNTGYVLPALTPPSGTENSTICYGDSITVNGTVYDANNPSGTEVIPGATSACDSTVTINLTVLPQLTGDVTMTLCNGDSLVVNGTTYNSGNPTGTEVFTGVGTYGCDSTVTINLSFSSSVGSSINTTICDGESIVVNGTTYDASNPSGVEVFQNVGPGGCDSTVTINLTALPPVTGSETSTICNNESITVNGTVYDASNPTGTEVIVGGSVNGCDSTVTVNLTVLPTATGAELSTICNTGSVVVNGTTYDASNPVGTEVITNGSVNGCDSTVNINLTVLPAIDNTVSNNSPTLTANESGATYQWIDCNNGNTPIAGETNQDFTATTNGNYAVEVTVGNCTETSACANVNNIGLEELGLTGISVYPNPSEGVFFLEIEDQVESVSYIVRDVEGRLIRDSKVVNTQSSTIDLSNESKGIYFLHVVHDHKALVFKLIIE